MTGELGHLALILALALAGVQALAGLLPQAPAALVHRAVGLQAVVLTAAILALGTAFVTADFSLMYVVQHSNADLPVPYRVAAIWGGHEGSMLLWVLILAGWSCWAGWRLAPVHVELARRSLGVLGLISVAMLGFVLFTSNPFVRLLPAAQDGQNLNPLLQDPGLIFHPPLLYLGYVGTAVPFAVVMARLMLPATGVPDTWVRALRPVVLWAFVWLTLGIALGSWWAYYELGWGGWWFWDPVENASFMPWLVLAALLHVLAAREARGALASWAGVLAAAAFALSLIGTFIVRSGVLTSVHAFATDPRRGSVMLALVALTLLGATALLSARMARLEPTRPPQVWSLASREAFLALNSALLLAACAAVLLGTLYPLALEALNLGKISVGPPYFDTMMLPLFLPLVAATVLGPSLVWGQDHWAALARRLAGVLVLSVLALVSLPWLLLHQFGRVSPLVVLGLVLAVAVVGSSLAQIWSPWRQRRALGQSAGMALWALGAGRWAMVTAHLGVAVFVVGVAMVQGYGQEHDQALMPGEQVALHDCLLRFEGVTPHRGANYAALAGHFELRCPGQAPQVLVTEKRSYAGMGMPMTESAIAWGLTRDLYVALGDMLGDSPRGGWMVRLQVKPFMRWVWWGAVLMALGGVLGAWARRYRHPAPARSPAGRSVQETP